MKPILFEIPGIEMPIFTYGVMLGLSLVAGYYLVTYLAKKDNLPGDALTGCYVWTAASALVGARLLYIVTNPADFFGDEGSLVDLFNVRKGGLVAYGGFLGGFAGSWLYSKRHGFSLLTWADAAVPALALGLALTRVGCLCYGCCYGRPIFPDAPSWIKGLGLRFPDWSHAFPTLHAKFESQEGLMVGDFQGAPAYLHHVHQGLVAPGDHYCALVYPTQIMEIASGLVALALTFAVRKYRRFKGEAFLAFTAYYGVARFIVEVFRGDLKRSGIGPVSTSQIVGIATFAVAAAVWWLLLRRVSRAPASAPPKEAPARADHRRR